MRVRAWTVGVATVGTYLVVWVLGSARAARMYRDGTPEFFAANREGLELAVQWSVGIGVVSAILLFLLPALFKEVSKEIRKD